MDLTECTSSQIIEFADGYWAAKKGQPFEDRFSEYWQAGYSLCLSEEADATKRVLH